VEVKLCHNASEVHSETTTKEIKDYLHKRCQVLAAVKSSKGKIEKQNIYNNILEQ